MSVIALNSDDSNDFEYRRNRIGASAQGIAGKLGVTYQTVRNMERGRWSYYSEDYDRLLTRLTAERRRELNREMSFDQLMDEFKELLRDRLGDAAADEER